MFYPVSLDFQTCLTANSFFGGFFSHHINVFLTLNVEWKSWFHISVSTSAERMFASRNTDGNEMSWSGINKRWVRKPGWSHRIFQLSTLFKSNAAAFSPDVCLSKNHLISLVKNGNLLFKVELFVSVDERHFEACMYDQTGRWGEKHDCRQRQR